ncbi:hypothetical protein J6590_017141 [Homalodisca vitripennis]|nr:hypothetical protein J6590_017141 [Homalodisca vitripennis]
MAVGKVVKNDLCRVQCCSQFNRYFDQMMRWQYIKVGSHTKVVIQANSQTRAVVCAGVRDFVNTTQV